MSREPVAVVGAGLIGRAWAIVFARAGYPVRLYDPDRDLLGESLKLIERSAADLHAAGLSPNPESLVAQVVPRSDLRTALAGAVYVQESGPEKVELKREIFAELDAVADPAAILASSSSGIVASAFTGELAGRHRCLIAHPVNPPYLIPLVELCPAPWTDPSVVARARALLEAAGQAPVEVRAELKGFVLNRLQGALLNEALRLYEDGYVSAEDIDSTVKNGLGLRWSFIGPFETIDLNAPRGLREYAERYGPLYEALGKEQADPRAWSPETVSRLERERRQLTTADGLGERQAWRDRRLMALAAHKKAQESRD